jgi:hypothetical protein
MERGGVINVTTILATVIPLTTVALEALPAPRTAQTTA